MEAEGGVRIGCSCVPLCRECMWPLGADGICHYCKVTPELSSDALDTLEETQAMVEALKRLYVLRDLAIELENQDRVITDHDAGDENDGQHKQGAD